MSVKFTNHSSLHVNPVFPELPAVPEGYSWEVKFYDEDLFVAVNGDVWELHLLDADGRTVFIDNLTESGTYLVPTEEDYIASANFSLNELGLAVA